MTTIEYPRIGHRGAARATTYLRHVLRRGRRERFAVERRAVRDRGAIAIRRAGAGDEAQLRQLAELCERPLPVRPLLVAEVDGEITVAVSVVTDEELRHPFRVTTDLVALLRQRAEQIRHAVSG